MDLFSTILESVLKLFGKRVDSREEEKKECKPELPEPELSLYDEKMKDPEFAEKVREEEEKIKELYTMADRDIEWHKSPNMSSGKGRKKTAIILHHTASFNFEGELRWMCDPAARVSAHYLIGLDGRIAQMVRDEDKAWHAGKSELDGVKYVNNFGIGIELTGDTAKKPLTQEQYDALVWLTKLLMDKHDIDAHRVVDHRFISPGRKVDLDPDNFDWTGFYRDIGAID